MCSLSLSGFNSFDDHQYVVHMPFEALQKRILDVQFDFSYKTPLHFLSYLEDQSLRDSYQVLKNKKDTPELKTVFVLGIGGANLGAQAIIDAFPKHESARSFVFLDTLYEGEEDEIRSITQSFKDPNEFLIIVISKSGKTIETVVNAKLLLSILEERFSTVKERIIVVTSKESPLHMWAHHHSITTSTIPQALTERFGLFSPVVIVPLLFSNLSLDDLYDGAKKALHDFTQVKKNTAPHVVRVATALDKRISNNIPTIIDFFFFNKNLEQVGKWSRQLFAESLGKSQTSLGQAFQKSITPTVSVGTTDLHSMLQLYLSQPEHRIAWFFNVESDHTNTIGDAKILHEILPKLSEETPEFILKVIYDSVIQTYTEHQLPYIESTLESVSEFDLGFHMMNEMLVVIILSELWNVNPYDQPHVEGYKFLIRKAL